MDKVHDKLLVWGTEVDNRTREQASRAARLPFVPGHVALMPDAQHVLEIDGSDHLLRLIHPDGETRMSALHHSCQNFIERGGGGNRHDVAARLHNLANGKVFKIEDTENHGLLRFWQVSGEAAGTDNKLEFFG